MKKFLLECESGIAGDMLVAAMLDLGADEGILRQALESLGVSGFDIKISRVKKAGIDACDFDVILDEDHENHDHDMEYLHGSRHDVHEDGGHHEHHHIHEHGGHDMERHEHRHHAHRHLSDIISIIDNAALTERAKDTAKQIFHILAAAEAKAHDMPVERVHFHEVGAVDSIVDIISIAVCADNLGIEEMIVPYLCEGHGTIRCAHGVLPIPVPAAANIISEYGIPLKRIDVSGEFVTPTGAAAAAAFATGFAIPEVHTIKRIGIGAGKRQYERASLIRLAEIEIPDSSIEKAPDTAIWKIESDIDDSTGEQLGYVMQRLYEAGAREVHYTPVFMKKNRPGMELVVICDEGHEKELEGIIFRDTSTIGLRKIKMQRNTLERTKKKIRTALGEAMIKQVRLPDGTKRHYPEYESVAEIAQRENVSYEEAFEAIKGAKE